MISLLDLSAQHAPLRADLDAALARVLTDCAFIQGSDVAAFATELSAYLAGCHVVPCANGTDALTIAFLALDLRPGDEVIVPAFTYVATAEAAALLGLRVILADVRPDTFTLDPAAVAAVATSQTRAVVPVHLFGQCADLGALLPLAARHGWAVVEDAAQALGATYALTPGERVFAGAAGTVGTTSFFPSKNLGAFGDGGALLTCDAALATRLREVANHGQPAGTKYRHERVGLNSRLDTLQAALLRVKLPYLPAWTARRQTLAARYDEGLVHVPGVRSPVRDPCSTHVFHQYVITLPDVASRDGLRAYLGARQIASAVYYPLPLHAQPAYPDLGQPGEFPVSETLCGTVLALPIHPTLTEAEIEEVCGAVADFCTAGGTR
ncbi:MAG: DegT/DnrJ/EryC1/StrS family aminotransferase [Hymenobacteraceae bacterium]|nr:DegT/DnrJ/EryC1/StrS family aminotransferase [Hymenobacteraceae bacterium]